MVEFYDPQLVLTTDWETFFVENRKRVFTIPCIEGDVEMTGAWCLLNFTLTMPLIKRGLPISRDKHLLPKTIYDSVVHAKVVNAVSKSLEEYGYTRAEICHDIIMTVNSVLNLCYTHLGGFVGTMDIFGIADTIRQPDAKKICTMDYGNIKDRNINRMEAKFKEQCLKVGDLFSGNTLETNVFRAPLLCKSLKKDQFYQFVLSAGPRTDTDDHIFGRPVVGSFLSGMKDIMDIAIESRAAAKAAHYNKSQMATTQYKNRKGHILNSTIRYLYPGDCGTTVYITYIVKEEYAKNYRGKYFVGPDGNLLELTEERYDMVIDREVQFRDTPTCRYTDGYCEVCGGTITKSFPKDGNVGFRSNVNTGAPIAQQVLSTKHLVSTDAAEYEVPDELLEVLMSSTNKIYIRPSLRKAVGTIVLGFPPKDVSKINDLKYSVTGQRAGYFTDIKYMYLGKRNEDGSIERSSNRTPMGGDMKTYPHLSAEILDVIRKHPEDISIQDGIVWFTLRNIDPDLPIMQCTVMNNSIKRFVAQYTSLVQKDAEGYTSLNTFMQDLTTLVFPRVSPNITHLSCIAKACLITSHKNFNVPIVTDPDKVMFSTLGKIIPMRSVGGLLAFERYNIATNKAVTYVTPKLHDIHDEYMGYTDTVERDMSWPVVTDSPVPYVD